MEGLLPLIWNTAPHWAHVAAGTCLIVLLFLGGTYYSLRYCNGICDQCGKLWARRLWQRRSRRG